jgi:hypothetical protein
MKVGLFFAHREDALLTGLVSSLFGKFNIGGFIFIHETEVDVFMTKQGETFYRYTHLRKPCLNLAYECLLLSVDEEEQQRLFSTCMACMQVKKPFNLQDILLLHAPFRDVEDLPIDQAPTLNNAQAIILILRECLRPDNRLREGIEGLHSRQTLLEDLFQRLQPLAVPVSWTTIFGLVKWGVGESERISARQH